MEDNATTVQTNYTLSLGIMNQDFKVAAETYIEDHRYFSPLLSMRCWINPTSEPDVKFVREEEVQTDEDKLLVQDGHEKREEDIVKKE